MNKLQKIQKNRGSNWLKKNLVGKRVIYNSKFYIIEFENDTHFDIASMEDTSLPIRQESLRVLKTEVKYCTDCYLKQYLCSSILL